MAGEAVLLCGRTVCANPAHPAGWNRITGEMYCVRCANAIHDMGGDTPGGILFPYLFQLVDPRTGPFGMRILIDETNLRKPTR